MTGTTRSVPARIHDELAGLGRRLKDVRELRGVSQRYAATLTDHSLTNAGLSRLEAGKRNDPLASTLLALCMALDVDIKLNRDGKITIHGTGLAGAGSGETNGGRSK